MLFAKIEKLAKEKDRLLEKLSSHDLRRADDLIEQLESTRDLSQRVVHVDCDAFFAAVEELDRPELKSVPMAVGKGVLSTCNYEARKFGCRSAMASFVAKRLCPQLVLLEPNSQKYSAKAQEIRAILEQYDPLFESASIDEAYLNITAFCAENQMEADEVVRKMREEIHKTTSISVSAGIAPNMALAKVASNRNKPNGQYTVPSDRYSIMEFTRDLPVRKVSGVGRVFERELGAIGIGTCGDIYTYRGILARLFGEKAFEFLMHRYLGLGRTNVQPVESSERKSVGNETTFPEMGDKAQIREKLWWAAQELERDLSRTQFKGRTLVLKVKLHTFEVLTRQTAPPRALFAARDLYNYALPMLSKLEKEIPGLKLRLIGLRCTHLVSTKKVEIDFFAGHHAKRPAVERVDGKEEVLNDETKNAVAECARKSRNEMEGEEELEERQQVFWDCPVCSRPQLADDRIFNDHVDFCLSRLAIKEAVHENVSADLPESSRKRKSRSGGSDPRQKRLFFS